MRQESIFTTEPVEQVTRDSVFPVDSDVDGAGSRSDRGSGGANPVFDEQAPFDRRFDAAAAVLGLDPSTLDFETPTVTRMRIESAAREATGEPDALVARSSEFLVDVVADPSAYPVRR